MLSKLRGQRGSATKLALLLFHKQDSPLWKPLFRCYRSWYHLLSAKIPRRLTHFTHCEFHVGIPCAQAFRLLHWPSSLQLLRSFSSTTWTTGASAGHSSKLLCTSSILIWPVWSALNVGIDTSWLYGNGGSLSGKTRMVKLSSSLP